MKNKYKVNRGEVVEALRGPFVHESKDFDILICFGSLLASKKRGSVAEKATFERLMNELFTARHDDTARRWTFRPIVKTCTRYRSRTRYSADHTAEILAGIKAFKKAVADHGIRTYVTTGNDSPRGGQLGKFIKVVVRLPKEGEEDK